MNQLYSLRDRKCPAAGCWTGECGSTTAVSMVTDDTSQSCQDQGALVVAEAERQQAPSEGVEERAVPRTAPGGARQVCPTKTGRRGHPGQSAQSIAWVRSSERS